MMFKLKPNPTFWAKVEISVPGADPATIEIEFRHKNRDELARWSEGLEQRPEVELLAEIVSNWRDVDTEYSVEALGRLCRDYVAAPRQIVLAYRDELRGARRKN